MTKILFVCHGNICRSVMAEFIMKKLVKDCGREDDFLIESAATSNEEIGNDIYPQAKDKLRAMGIPFTTHSARRITFDDYAKYDLIIGMDIENLYRMENLWTKDPDNKVKLLMTYCNKDRDISDPWYSGDFDRTYNDLMEGITALLKRV